MVIQSISYRCRLQFLNIQAICGAAISVVIYLVVHIFGSFFLGNKAGQPTEGAIPRPENGGLTLADSKDRTRDLVTEGQRLHIFGSYMYKAGQNKGQLQ